ncbi:PQQ-dependent sugar dehydrogenase [Inquilinus sp. NPDC058860]|uniref:PQQ-dependent sugar dehydrogenase n=1 Tax=Inquilinus sp. NPDC058860 TaxID=3346652 RepID=UPI0036959316
MIPRRSLLRLLALALPCVGIFAGVPAQAAGIYRTSGDCDGFPKVSLRTPDGLCVGLVASRLGFTRGVAVIGDDIYVADMGSWEKGRGRLLRLPEGGRGAPQVLLTRLDRPNGLVPTADGTLLLGLAGRVVSVDPKAEQPAAALRDVVTGLPNDGRHPLAALALASDGALFVNVGSATDHCERADDSAPDPAKPCPETGGTPPRGSVLRVAADALPADARTLAPFARGLRNSMALAVLPNGTPLALVNARDAIDQADPGLSDEALPHDFYTVLRENADYGWPYCYDDRKPSPEYPHFDCSRVEVPTLLLPPHAAPLGMLVYRGSALPGLEGRVLMTYHGYRDTGHRVVALAIDDRGLPQGEPQPLVSGWDAAKGVRPQGAPLGLAELADGSVLISEDHNGTLLRLARARPAASP